MIKESARMGGACVVIALTWCSASILTSTAPCLAEPTAPSYAEHQRLDYYLDDDGARHSIDSVEDWSMRRKHVLAHVQSVMGPLPRPDDPVPLEPTFGPPKPLTDCVRRKVSYHTDSPAHRVTAWLFIPDKSPGARTPAVLCLHQTTEIGKDEPAGLGGSARLHYALELANRGFVTLAPDYPSLGEYTHDFGRDEYDSGSMKAIYDNVRAIDLLQSLDYVDAERIGCIGHSLGGHNGIFTAVFDARLKAVASCCGFTRFHRYMGGDLSGWAGPRYMPRIASVYDNRPDAVPFDFTELVAAVAPRAFLAVAPLRDDNFDVQGVRDVIEAARPIYRLHGVEAFLEADYPDAAHDFPDKSRMQAYDFLRQRLAAGSTNP